MAERSQCRAKVDCRRRLTDTTLLVGNRDDLVEGRGSDTSSSSDFDDGCPGIRFARMKCVGEAPEAFSLHQFLMHRFALREQPYTLWVAMFFDYLKQDRERREGAR